MFVFPFCVYFYFPYFFFAVIVYLNCVRDFFAGGGMIIQWIFLRKGKVKICSDFVVMRQPKAAA
jgi:hypothetical protein